MSNKDWTGNKNSIFKTLGASNHTEKERQNEDYYATDPEAISKLITKYQLPEVIYEPCCGEGHLAKRLMELGHTVIATDLIDRGFGKGGVDFLKVNKMPENCKCILTNPPYKIALSIILHALEILPEDGECIMFLKTTFLEGKKRFQELYSKCPPVKIYQFSERVMCAKNGDFETMIKGGGSAVSYLFMIFKPHNKNLPTIDWI